MLTNERDEGWGCGYQKKDTIDENKQTLLEGEQRGFNGVCPYQKKEHRNSNVIQ